MVANVTTEAKVISNQLGRRRANRVFRERFYIENMSEEEFQRCRFRKELIKQILDLLDPIIGPRNRGTPQALSTYVHVHNLTNKVYLA